MTDFDQRFRKLHFILQELELSALLAKSMPTDFSKRTIARHVIVRARDFLDHCRGLKRPLAQLGRDVRKFNSDKETYADYFNEYFQTSRHKLAAHLQDVDFGKRIELWDDIEWTKVQFFTESAREIYSKSIKDLSPPNYVEYQPPSALTSPLDLKTLFNIQLPSTVPPGSVVSACDALALTRPDTVALLNQTLVHQRAQQLETIDIWMADQSILLAQAENHTDIARILKARMLSDVVSFADCLVTRTDAGTLQEQDGLDKLLREKRGDPKPIDDFVASYRFSDTVECLRHVRNMAGSHFDISDASSLQQLLELLDTLDVVKMIAFHARMYRVFAKACQLTDFMAYYGRGINRLRNITPSKTVDSDTPFEEPIAREMPPNRTLSVEDYSDDTLLRRMLDSWISSPDRPHDLWHFFYGAFASSQTVEAIARAGFQGKNNVLRHAHVYVFKQLVDARSRWDALSILELITSCAQGYPVPLAEMILRYLELSDEGRPFPIERSFIYYFLGEVERRWETPVTERLLAECRNSSAPPLELFEACVAVFKPFVWHIARQKGKCLQLPDSLIEGSKALPPACRLALRIAMLSMMDEYNRYDSNLRVFDVHFKSILADASLDVAELAPQWLLKDKVQDLPSSHHYIGITADLARHLDGAGRKDDASILRWAVISGRIVNPCGDEFQKNLAVTFLDCGLKKQALDIASRLAMKSPDDKDQQYFYLKFARACGAPPLVTLSIARNLKGNYNLSSEELAAVEEIESELRLRTGRHTDSQELPMVIPTSEGDA